MNLVDSMLDLVRLPFVRVSLSLIRHSCLLKAPGCDLVVSRAMSNIAFDLGIEVISLLGCTNFGELCKSCLLRSSPVQSNAIHPVQRSSFLVQLARLIVQTNAELISAGKRPSSPDWTLGDSRVI